MKSQRLPIRSAGSFTMVEMLVSMAVLFLLILLIAQLFSNTSKVITVSTDHLAADDQVRLLFERMAADFGHLVKRPDVDYYLKAPGYVAASSNSVSANLESGNDQLAFYSEVPGYTTATNAVASISLVSYRVNVSSNSPYMERMGKGLTWSAGASDGTPIVFEPLTLSETWPTATSGTLTDADYEPIAPNVFRFEYYYLLTSGALSATPWDTVAGSTNLNALKDVVAIGVVVAATDPKAAKLASMSELTSLAGQLPDFTTGATTNMGQLETEWQAVVSASTLVPAIKSGIHIYGRLFYIGGPNP